MKGAPYHHGDLHTALLAAAEAIVERGGVASLTMRGAARAAGVSHAAPLHHFGDLTGLCSELAAVGYRRFTQHLASAAALAAPDPQERMVALGKAYVGFADQYHGLFELMFRNDRLDRARPSLRDASTAAFAVLSGSVQAARPGSDPFADAIGAWCLVHGFAMLLINGQLPPKQPPEDLLDAILRRRQR